MAVEKIVLVVSPTASVAQAVAATARRCGYTPYVVRTFAEAKKQMLAPPHLLVTELKLAEYNGLQLALRAKLSETPAVVIAESPYEHEVEQHGAAWVSPSMITTGELETLMVGLVQGTLAASAAYPWYEAGTTSQNGQLTKWQPPTPLQPH
jgi:hypothetical protein